LGEAAHICNCSAVRCLVERHDADPIAAEPGAFRMTITTSSWIFIAVLKAEDDLDIGKLEILTQALDAIENKIPKFAF
jgi:hypothetical protein